MYVHMLFKHYFLECSIFPSPSDFIIYAYINLHNTSSDINSPSRTNSWVTVDMSESPKKL